VNPRTISLLSAARNLIVLTILLTSCQSAPTKARKIMGPITKRAAQASALVERQTGSIARLRTSVADAAQTAKRLAADRPDGDTASLLLSLRIATSETDALRGTNDDLRLAISGMEVVIAQAQDKISVEIAGAETWRAWAWRWWWAFSATVAGIAALVYFRHSVPLLRFL